MFHQNFVSTSKRLSFQIQNNVSKLLFTMKWKSGCMNGLVSAAVGAPAQLPNFVNWPAYLATDFGYALKDGTISVTRHSGTLGPKNLIQSMKLSDLAEICANNEGYIEIKTGGTTTVAGVKITEYIARFSVELSNSGSLHADKGDFLKIDLEGFEDYHDAIAGDFPISIDINSLGSYVTVNEHIKYSPVACQANQQQLFDCISHYALAMPSTLVKSTLSSATGEILEILAEEMEIVACDLSDIVYLVDNSPVPYLKWRVFPIQLAHKANVQLTQNGQCYLIGNKNYDIN